MWPDRVSNPGPPTYESGALPMTVYVLLFNVLVASLCILFISLSLMLPMALTGCPGKNGPNIIATQHVFLFCTIFCFIKCKNYT